MDRPTLNPGLTQRLAELGLSIAAKPLPAPAARIACHSLLDWFAVAHAGWDAAPVRALHEELVDEGSSPRVTVLDGSLMSCTQAALLNGTASHVLDFDDAHLQSRVHPSVPLWPAILAQAQDKRLSGARALAAFVAGVEMQSRIALVMGEDHYARGWHNTATLGTLGAAAAVASLLGLDVPRTCHALAIAATRAGGMRAVFGTGCKPLHAGQAAAVGLQSARLAARGFTGVTDILERDDGFDQLYSGKLFPEAAFADDTLRVHGIVYKYHASCYGTQAPIDAAIGVRGQIQGRDDAIRDIRVVIEPQYLDVCCIAEPSTVPEAKFSIAHMTALALAGRSTVAPESFSPAALADEHLTALRRQVSVQGSDAMPRANAQVTVTLLDGGEFTLRVDASRPERDLDRQQARLQAKAATLLEPVVGAGRASALARRVLAFADEPDVAAFMAATHPVRA